MCDLHVKAPPATICAADVPCEAVGSHLYSLDHLNMKGSRSETHLTRGRGSDSQRAQKFSLMPLPHGLF